MTIYNVTSGQPFSGVTLGRGSFAYVSSGGVASATMIQDEAGLTVFAGGIASFTVLSGGAQYVSSGGQARGTLVRAGTESVDGGGSAAFSVVSGNGSETVYSGGTALSAVLSGGQEAVYAGGTADDTVVSNGGVAYVYAGGTANGTVLRSGGDLDVVSAGTATDTVISNGGTMIDRAGGSATFTVVSPGGSIDLPYLVFTGGGSATVNNDDTLTVTEGASSATLQLNGLYAGESFRPITESTGGDGTVVTLTEAPRTLAWTGAQDSDFANAADWNDLTNILFPAAEPPNATDTAELLTSGGTVTGSGTVATLTFGGAGAWEVTSGASLSADSGTGGITVDASGAGSVLIDDGASLHGLGTGDVVGEGAVTVFGTGAAWTSAALLWIGGVGTAVVSIGDGAILSAATMLVGGSAGTSGALVVSGDGAMATVTRWLDVGYTGTITVDTRGTLSVGDPGDYLADFDLADSEGGLGEATVTGVNSLLSNIGGFTVGDDGLGSLLIDDGGTVTTAPAIVTGVPAAVIADSAYASGSSVGVSGDGSNWRVTGELDVGAGGIGALSLTAGATVTAGSLDAANVAAAVGQISLAGTGTELIVTGAATIADDGAGVLSVLSGATFSAASLTIGAQSDSSGAAIVSGSGSVLDVSGSLNIGTANGTGDLTVGPGAAITAQAVFQEGQVVLEGGLLDPTVQLINQGQTAGGFGTIAAGDIVDEGAIQAGGDKGSQKLLIVQGTVLGGGTLTLDGTLPGSVPAGILQINAGGTLELSGAVLNAATTTFTDNLTPTGTYTVSNSVIDVNFVDSAGVLLLHDIAGFSGTIVTYQAGDSFVISGGTLSGLNVSNGNTLTVSDSGANAGAGGIDDIIFGSAVSAAGFKIVNNDTIQAQLPCFAAGTRIETEHGPVAVEDLVAGDRVVTSDGAREPIVWIGRRNVNCARHPKPGTVWPVRVRAGAFGENVPLRDLYLSPDHAVLLNDVLVPVRLLINGIGIAQVRRAQVTYFHVELRHHAIILAEGLTVESYLDLGDRANFGSGEATIRLFADFAARLSAATALVWETKGAAPLVMTGAGLLAARRSVAANECASEFRTARVRTRSA